jgi:hypothetical protein
LSKEQKLVTVAISLLLAGAAQAANLHPAATAQEGAGTPLNYAGMIKIIGAAKGDKRVIDSKLVGRTVVLKLIAPGPQSLVVNVKDGVFFVCQKRDPAFKAGNLQTKVLAYETTPDGDMSITLESCKK